MSMLKRRVGVLERRARAAAAMPALPGGGRPLTGEELADRLGITGETVRRWAALGMPSCGTHPSRPAWPLYDEAACRGWAAREQPQTALRPPAAPPARESAPATQTGESLAELKVRRLRASNEVLRLRLAKEASRLVRADQVHAAAARHATAVRARCRELPRRAAASLASRFGLTPEERAGLERLIGGEVELALEELRDDPMAKPSREDAPSR